MKITILVDNKDGGQFKGEWGLSFYIEYREKTILLDAGLSGLFAENAKAMGIDLRNVDMAVLSHAHDDHANGLDTFFGINDRAPLYVAHGCDENCYDRNEDGYKYAGIPLGFMTRHANRIVRSDGDMYISDGIRLLGHITPGLEEIGLAENMYLKQGNEFVPDDFRHEQSLIFETEEGIVIFNSCSHAGADNIVNEARQMYPESSILAMIGGFPPFQQERRIRRGLRGAAGIHRSPAHLYRSLHRRQSIRHTAEQTRQQSPRILHRTSFRTAVICPSLPQLPFVQIQP